jgi:hypothetical protein
MTRWLRAAHRWLGMSLVALTLINIAAFSMGQVIAWLYYLPLLPLFLSMLSGTWMFVEPYLRARRAPE